MVTVNYDGRLGNNMIQYSAALFFSKKHNLQFIPPSHPMNYFFNLVKNDGNLGNKIYEINDFNFLNEITKDAVEINHFIFNGFFQEKMFLEKHEKEIKNFFKIKYSPTNSDSVFVHYRIGDIINDRRMLPVEYYEEALDNLSIKNGYISSDTINHKFCNHLIKKYNLKPIVMNPLDIINFGKNFNNIVLSEGTFSWWIGFLSQAENIFCNKRNYLWHGDIFFEKWKKLSWDYESNSIYDIYKLNEYKPINLKSC